nr:uncharacterized protein LOC112000055 [Quercus suber]
MSWCLWQRRNRLRMKQSVWPLHEVGDRAKGLVLEFFDANKPEARPRVHNPPTSWVPPEDGLYKVNYDAAIFDSLGYAGLGVVIRDCTVEGDCLKVVQALKARDRCNTLYGNVIEDARLQGAAMQACHFQHVRREGNKLAHALARRAVSSADFNVWVEELPSDLEDVFLSDVSALA